MEATLLDISAPSIGGQSATRLWPTSPPLEATLLDVSGQHPIWGPAFRSSGHCPLPPMALCCPLHRLCQGLLCCSLTFSGGGARCYMAPAHFSLLQGQSTSDPQEILVPSTAPQVPVSVSNTPTLLALHFCDFLGHESGTPASALPPPAGTEIKLS